MTDSSEKLSCNTVQVQTISPAKKSDAINVRYNKTFQTIKDMIKSQRVGDSGLKKKRASESQASSRRPIIDELNPYLNIVSYSIEAMKRQGQPKGRNIRNNSEKRVKDYKLYNATSPTPTNQQTHAAFYSQPRKANIYSTYGTARSKGGCSLNRPHYFEGRTNSVGHENTFTTPQ